MGLSHAAARLPKAVFLLWLSLTPAFAIPLEEARGVLVEQAAIEQKDWPGRPRGKPALPPRALPLRACCCAAVLPVCHVQQAWPLLAEMEDFGIAAHLPRSDQVDFYLGRAAMTRTRWT